METLRLNASHQLDCFARARNYGKPTTNTLHPTPPTASQVCDL